MRRLGLPAMRESAGYEGYDRQQLHHRARHKWVPGGDQGEGGGDVAPGNPGISKASEPPKWQIRQSDPPDTRNPPQALGFLPGTGGNLPWSGLASIQIQRPLG